MSPALLVVAWVVVGAELGGRRHAAFSAILVYLFLSSCSGQQAGGHAT